MANPIHRVGPCYIFAGNPNIANGAGMTTLGYTRGDVTVAPNLNISTGRVDQLGMSALAGSAWSGGIDPVATMPLIDEDKDKIVKYVASGKKATANSQTSFGFGSGFTKLDTLNTLALIPFDELDEGTNGIDAPNAVWFPAFVVFDFGTLTYNLPEGTDDAHVVHEVQARGLLVDFDDRPDTAGGNKKTGANRILLPREHRSMFIGSPRSLSAQTAGGTTYAANSWSLPATTVV